MQGNDSTHPSGKKRILVADDEPSVREFLLRALAHTGFDVNAVADGNAALAALDRAPYDMILTDIVMPDMDGVALALKVAKDFPAMKIILMSGYADQRERVHNLDQLAHAVVSKPFTLEEITRRVTSAAQQG